MRKDDYDDYASGGADPDAPDGLPDLSAEKERGYRDDDDAFGLRGDARGTGFDADDETPDERTKRRTGWFVAIGIAAVVVVTLVLGTTVFRSVLDDPDPTPSASSGSTASGHPEVIPGESTTPDEGGQPSPEPTTHGTTTCPEGDPYERRTYPDDGRVHGGGISFTQLSGHGYGGQVTEPRMSFAYDVMGQDSPVTTGWASSMVVGELRKGDGFEDPQAAVESLMECAVSTSMYEIDEVGAKRADYASEAVTIDGHQGWIIKSQLTNPNYDIPFPGDDVYMMVLDMGDDMAFFFGCTPLEVSAYDGIMDDTFQSLQVD